MKHSYVYFIIVLLTVLTSVLLKGDTFTFGFIGIDDANIFFAYAKSNLRGDLFEWSHSGQRVEGFSSIIWLLVSTAMFQLSSDPEIALLAVNCCLLSLTLWGGWHVSNRVFGSERLPLACALLVYFLIASLSSAGFFVWQTVSLMDTGLWLFGVTTCMILGFLRNFGRIRLPLFCGALACLPLIRSEGLLISVVILGCSFIVDWSLKKEKLLKNHFTAILSLMAVAVGLVVLRLAIFGYPLPNTFYAKVSLDSTSGLTKGYNYLTTFFDRFGFGFLMAIVSLIAFGRSLWVSFSRPLTKVEAWLFYNASLTLVILSVYLVLGGDHFALSRQYQVCWLSGVIVVVGSVLALVNKYLPDSRSIPPTAVLLLAVLTFWMNLGSWNGLKDIQFEFLLAEQGRHTGKLLNKIFPENERPRVGALAVGGFAYSYEGYVVDLLGINNPAMAHASTDRSGMKNHAAFHRETFFKLKPDLIIHYGPSCYPRTSLVNQEWFVNYMKGLPKEPEFTDVYSPLPTIFLPSDDVVSHAMCGFIHKDFVPSAKKHGLL